MAVARVAGAILLAAAFARPASGADEAGAAQAPQAAAAAPAPELGGTAPREGAPLGEEIVVTATRGPRPIRDTPAAVTVLPRAEIERSPTKTVDELLRIVPSFGLLRLTSSVVADPSSQGVNLRGIGPSGASRSLVLVDGIPANDPFGDWVYWRAIPRIGIQRIEVVPGGGSALYGNYALGGVTQVFSRPITPLTLDATAEYGSFHTYQLGLRAADRRGPVGGVIEAELFKSDGYPVVAPYARGPIDTNASSWDGVVNARVEARATPDLTFTVRGGYFYEDEKGGTRYTTAAVRRLEYGAGVRYAPGSLGVFDLNVFGHRNDFKQLRARVAPDRTSESLSASQDVPAHDIGVGLLWTSRPLALAGTHTVMVGSDVRGITGDTREDLFPPPPVPLTSVVQRDASGTQWLYGVFAQDVYDVSDAVAVDLAVRYDRWDNTDASLTTRTAGGSTTFVGFPRRSDDQVSPKAGLRLRPLDWLTLRAAAYRAFRAPTLNELYRPFQVGTVLTQANENLGPETLKGAEAGFEVAAPYALTVRATGFWNEMDDPITNVTIGTNRRQRQNLGQARIRGIEAEADWRFARVWLATAAYTYVDSKVTQAPGQPQLVGKELPLDPKQRASVSLAFDDPRLLSAVVQVRYVGQQYEDDLNTLPMGDFVLVDLSVSPRVTANVDVVLAVENLFNKEYLVGRAGVDTVGQPRYIHGGVRVHW